MSRLLHIARAGPGVTVQDLGRTGHLAQGLSRGGAVDRLAIHEGAALLGQDTGLAVLEIGGSMLALCASTDLRFALTGAEMHASVDGTTIAWNASHLLPAKALLEISAIRGGFGYLHIGGGVDTLPVLSARSVHLACGLGTMVQPGDKLAVGDDSGTRTGMCLEPQWTAESAPIRLVPSLQTDTFASAELDRFTKTIFHKDARGNRMGQRLAPPERGFDTANGLKILSETIVPGDIQITGDGTPFVLLAECQTTGGYPRIGTVLPCDLPRLVRAPAGSRLRFSFIELTDAVELERADTQRRAQLATALQPLRRDPGDLRDLLGYQLISGVTAGDDLERAGQCERTWT